MNMTVATELFLRNTIRGMRGKGRYSKTVDGQIIFPIGKYIPIIERGVGCIGFALINEFTVTSNSTTVTFDFAEAEDSTAASYYKLHKLNAGDSDFGDDGNVRGFVGSKDRTGRSLADAIFED